LVMLTFTKGRIRNCFGHGQQAQAADAMKELRGLYGNSFLPVSLREQVGPRLDVDVCVSGL
jgi:hypothetical protein